MENMNQLQFEILKVGYIQFKSYWTVTLGL